VSTNVVIDVEVFGAPRLSRVPPLGEMRRLCEAAATRAGVQQGHLAIEFVDAHRISELNREHRGEPAATDVLSFPIDGVDALGDHRPAAEEEARASGGSMLEDEPRTKCPRELGDVVICLAHTVDVREAIVHGVLHLVGMDHETDDGEMLALQRELLSREAG
jgi:probable rRNA maturation factor